MILGETTAATAMFGNTVPYPNGPLGGVDILIGTLGVNGVSLSAIGGQGDDHATSLVAINPTVYNSATTFVAGGYTNSTDFPLLSAYQSKAGGGIDGWLVRFTVAQSDPAVMLNATYWCGSGDDRINALAVGANSAEVIVAGTTSSPNFPAMGAARSKLAGSSDGFVVRFDVATWLPTQSGLFGGSGTIRFLTFAWNGTAARQIRVGEAAYSTVSITSTGSYFRAGALLPSISLAADPPEAAVIAPGTLTFSTFPSAGFSIAPTALGNFDVVATLPDGSTIRMPIQALPRLFGFNCGGRDPIVGQDLYITCSVTTSNNVPVAMTSEDPSQLVVSSSETSAGVGTLLFDSVGNAPNTFYAQALGSTGPVNIVFQAPGYDDLKVPVVLQKTGIVVTPNFGIATAGATPLSGSTTMTASIIVVNSTGQALFGVPNKLRPGVSFTVKVTSSDPAVVVLDTGSIQFQVGDQQKAFNLKPGRAGTSAVTNTSPAAYPVIGNSSYLFEVK